VVSGASQFGLAANVALLLARSNNVPLVAVAPASGTGSDPEKSKDQVVVRADSGISSYADLTVRTVAVVAVKNSPEPWTHLPSV
jgi:ABC-type nitrate/sulfonate/bicarbonate transport system substrate-binding protein